MYRPFQAPHLLNEAFAKHISYTEEVIDSLRDFVICLWKMVPKSEEKTFVNSIIVADGCIDLVADYDAKSIGFSGMSKTVFHFTLPSSARFFGTRMKPGTFHQLTGLPAASAMDSFLPLEQIDANFDADAFFALPFEKARTAFKDYVEQFIAGKAPDAYVSLFDQLSASPPADAGELYTRLHLSPRQCQRLFAKHFGLTPQMALSILRFQHCLALLTSGEAASNDVLRSVNYYDQSHFIKDFKRNIGLTPLEYLQNARNDAYIQYSLPSAGVQ